MPLLRTPRATISYRRTGRGPAVLLIQGAGLIGDGWRPQVHELADRYTVLAFDNRGFGQSTFEAGDRLTIEDMASDAAAIMDAEGIERFHLVGHSMGGLIAQALTLTARERVKSLSLLCTFVRGREAARLTPALLLTALRMRIGTSGMRRNAFLRLIMPPAFLQTIDRGRLAQDMAPLFGYDLSRQPSFVIRQVQAMRRYDEADRWPELASVPTLVVCAAHDRIALPRYGRTVASLVPNARLVEFPDAGHGVTIQCAREINALLDGHFAEAERRSAPTPLAAQSSDRPVPHAGPERGPR